MMTDPLVQVIHSPVIALALTLAAFLCAVWLYRRSGWLVLQPVLVTMLIIIGGIRLLGLDYQAYREAVVPISWLLGPATVALAVPLYRNVRRIRQALWPVMLTLLVGGVAIVALTLLFARWLGADAQVLMTLATKSVTMPIAMPLAEQLGGIAALAAVLVMLTGVAGTAMLPPLLNLCGVQHPAARGMARARVCCRMRGRAWCGRADHNTHTHTDASWRPCMVQHARPATPASLSVC